MNQPAFRDYVLKYKKLLHDNSAAFGSTFGVPLSRFWNTLTGFDIVSFDLWIDTPDGTSLESFITTKYGDEATKLVRNLLG